MVEKINNFLERNQVLKSSGLIPLEWMVLEDLEHHLIIRNKLNGEIKVIDK
jgi:hypothetical protein